MPAILRPSTLWAALVLLLSLGVALFSYRYLFGGPFLAPNVVENRVANPFLALHVAGAATALLVGPFQFVAPLRRRSARIHRWLGRTYVAGCMLGGAAGLPLALGSTGGPLAASGFAVLSIVWLRATWLGWRYAVARRFAEHRRWMLRSWAMTLAAVTLRLMVPMIPFTGVETTLAYGAIAWLCWTVNLALLELGQRWSSGWRRSPSPA